MDSEQALVDVAKQWLTNEASLKALRESHPFWFTRVARGITPRRWSQTRFREEIQQQLARQLRLMAAGSRPSKWTSLSGVNGRFLLESSLFGYRSIRHNSVDTLGRLRDWVEQNIVAIRARAELAQRGNPVSEDLRELEQRIRDCVDSLPEQTPLRGVLVEHLSHESRPKLKCISEWRERSARGYDHPIERSVTLTFDTPYECWDTTEYPYEQWINLHFIGVHEQLRGLGLGTAALRELCHHADEHELPVIATIQPPETTDGASPSLVNFYSRLGFYPLGPEQDEWRPGGRILRKPQIKKV